MMKKLLLVSLFIFFTSLAFASDPQMECTARAYQRNPWKFLGTKKYKTIFSEDRNHFEDEKIKKENFLPFSKYYLIFSITRRPETNEFGVSINEWDFRQNDLKFSFDSKMFSREADIDFTMGNKMYSLVCKAID